MFPFASLHPNADARLRAEILLLPENLINPSGIGELQMSDHVLNSPLPIHAPNNSSGVAASAGQNCDPHV